MYAIGWVWTYVYIQETITTIRVRDLTHHLQKYPCVPTFGVW